MQQSRASQYAQILERVRTGEIGLRDAQKIMLELGALPEQERIKRESELEKRRRLVPIEVGQKVQEQDILGPKRTQEEVSKKTALNKVFDPLTDPYHKGVNDVSKDVLNPEYVHSDPDIMNQKRQLLLQKLTEGALASNDPRIKTMIQDVKAISEGKPEDFDANLKKAMSNVLWGQPEKNTIDIETAFKRMGGRDAVYQRQNAPLEELIKQKTIENIPGPWGDNFRKMGPLPTPAPGSQLDQSGMPGQMGVPATRTSSAGFINPQGDFSADPAELATKAATGQSLLSQWLAQSDPNMMQQSSGLSPEDQWTQRKDGIAGRSQDRNNVFSAEGLPPVGDMAQAPQPQPDFSSLTATGQPPEKSDTYYQMLAYMQAEEEKKQREMDGRPPYDQWAEAPQDQFVPGYSSLEG
jgi:hypothetical protein